MTTKHVKGCGNFDSANQICRLMHTSSQKPLMAHEQLIDPPGALEGPPAVVQGWICVAAGDFERQKSCSAYKPRLASQDEDDMKL